jgi:hypothetical protein
MSDAMPLRAVRVRTRNTVLATLPAPTSQSSPRSFLISSFPLHREGLVLPLLPPPLRRDYPQPCPASHSHTDTLTRTRSRSHSHISAHAHIHTPSPSPSPSHSHQSNPSQSPALHCRPSHRGVYTNSAPNKPPIPLPSQILTPTQSPALVSLPHHTRSRLATSHPIPPSPFGASVGYFPGVRDPREGFSGCGDGD